MQCGLGARMSSRALRGASIISTYALLPSIFWFRLQQFIIQAVPDLAIDVPMNDAGRAHMSLETLPSELRKLIVSSLAPIHLSPGCKQAIKNANLAHRSLHAWATEYLFQDMVLVHAVPGMASHLEYFTTHREAAGFMKYVRSVVIQASIIHKWSSCDSDCLRCHQHCVGKSGLTGLSSAERHLPGSDFISHLESNQARE